MLRVNSIASAGRQELNHGQTSALLLWFGHICVVFGFWLALGTSLVLSGVA